MGCDCLGTIKYFDGTVVAADGSAAPRPNAICVHEVDNGIQWKVDTPNHLDVLRRY